MKYLSSFIIFGLVIFPTNAEESRDIDKRYLAALAKNGRLPKLTNAQKKDEARQVVPQSFEKDEDFSRDALMEEKRHVGAFLKVHGKPIFTRSESYADDSKGDGKRNVALMARLGRLNAIRFANMQPYSVGGKRMSSEDSSNNNQDNAINIFEDPDCFKIKEEPGNDGDERPIWIQKKRYVARTGRLPIWHSQKMWWGGKRDDSPRPYLTSSGLEDAKQAENTLDDMSFVTAKSKRCKKIYDNEMGKRNVAALAKNGKLPFRQILKHSQAMP